MNIFNIYHQITKNTSSVLRVFKSQENIPKHELPIFIKTYPRFKKIALPRCGKINMSLSDTLIKRESVRIFNGVFSTQIISDLLFYSLSKKEGGDVSQREKRMYPSGGALYPLEFYVFIFSPTGPLQRGIYHYGYEDNSLTLIKKNPFTKETMEELVMYDFTKKASFAVVITSVFSRSVQKYKERAYHFILLEAGGVAQNLSLCATALSIPSVQMGGLIDEKAEKIMDIDGSNESIIHSVFFG